MKHLNAFSEAIYRKFNLKVMMVAVVIFLLFSATIFPLAMYAQEKAAGTTAMPDTLLFVSADEYFDLAESYGEAGRSAYIWLRFTFDLAWPAVYGFVLIAGLSCFAGASKHGWVKRLNLLPILGVLFDLAENILAVVYIARFPAETAWAVALLPYITAAKWAVLGLSLLAVLGLSVARAVKAIEMKTQKGSINK